MMSNMVHDVIHDGSNGSVCMSSSSTIFAKLDIFGFILLSEILLKEGNDIIILCFMYFLNAS